MLHEWAKPHLHHCVHSFLPGWTIPSAGELLKQGQQLKIAPGSTWNGPNSLAPSLPARVKTKAESESLSHKHSWAAKKTLRGAQLPTIFSAKLSCKKQNAAKLPGWGLDWVTRKGHGLTCWAGCNLCNELRDVTSSGVGLGDEAVFKTFLLL